MSSAWDGLENSLRRTELPHYAASKSMPEDAFYTQERIAAKCWQTFQSVCRKEGLDLSGHTFIEPSAGEGCFFQFLPKKRIGLDIQPGAPGIRQADFLTWQPSTRGKYAVIGNPPFGHRGAVALAFIKRAFLFADVVAFILPMSFYSNGKGSNMKRVEGAYLAHNERLPCEAFYWPGSHKPMSVNAVFQVWVKGDKRGVFADYDISEFAEIYTCCSSPARYCGLGRGRQYDCFIASTFYDATEIVYRFRDVRYGSGYGIIIKKHRQRVLALLKRADWRQNCSDATNHCKHIRMHHIRHVLGANGFGAPK